jgi:hypothetical protein
MSILPITVTSQNTDFSAQDIQYDGNICIIMSTGLYNHFQPTYLLNIYLYDINGNFINSVDIGSSLTQQNISSFQGIMNFDNTSGYVYLLAFPHENSVYGIDNSYNIEYIDTFTSVPVPICSVINAPYSDPHYYFGAFCDGDVVSPTIYSTNENFTPLGENALFPVRLQLWNDGTNDFLYFNNGTSYLQDICSVDLNGNNLKVLISSVAYQDFKVENSQITVTSSFNISIFDLTGRFLQVIYQIPNSSVSLNKSMFNADTYPLVQNFTFTDGASSSTQLNSTRTSVPLIVNLPYKYSTTVIPSTNIINIPDIPLFNHTNAKNLMVAIEYINIQYTVPG